jgi:hypothetical protein
MSTEIITKPNPPPEKKPNELGGVEFSSHLVISDPNTKEVIVNVRAD